MYSLEKWDQVVHKTVVASNIKMEYQVVEQLPLTQKETKIVIRVKSEKGERVLVGSGTLSYL